MDRLKSDDKLTINLTKVVSELKKDPLFTNINIDILNLNSCLILQQERRNCNTCLGLASCKNGQTGFYTAYDEENDAFVLKRCAYKKELDTKNRESSLIKTLFIPKSIKEAKLEDFQVNTEERALVYQKVINFIANYPNSCKKGIYLYGTYGCGKTYILAALARELAKKNISTLLIYFPDLIHELKDSISDNRFGSLINELKSVDVLMLDDIGSENMTSFVRDEVLGPVLNYRMAEGKPLFLTSNLTPEQLVIHMSLGSAGLEQTKAMRIMSRIGQVSETINMGRRKYNGNC